MSTKLAKKQKRTYPDNGISEKEHKILHTALFKIKKAQKLIDGLIKEREK
jgi:hypothetical protein